MGVHYEWADERQMIMQIYVESPWTWQEYHAMVATVMPMIAKLQYPCATTVDVTKSGALPRGNIIQNFLDIEKQLPDNIFVSVVIGAPYTIMVFMNMLTQLRPRAKRLALFTRTQAEAHEKIYARYRELFPDLAAK